MPGGLEVFGGIGQERLGVARAHRRKLGGDLDEPGDPRPQKRRELGRIPVGPVRRVGIAGPAGPLGRGRPVARGRDPFGQCGQPGAPAREHLATQQILPLDPVGALVDRVEPVVAVVLFHVVVDRVSGPAEHLNRQLIGLQTPL